jgi:hypothetical protein
MAIGSTFTAIESSRRMTTRWILALSLAFGCIGCQPRGATADAAPAGSAVRITRIVPDVSTALRVGDHVDLEVVAEYTLSAESGTLALVVQTADNSVLANRLEVVARGSGAVSLKTSIVIPQTTSIAIFTPLAAQGQTATSTVDTRAIKVSPK